MSNELTPEKQERFKAMSDKHNLEQAMIAAGPPSEAAPPVWNDLSAEEQLEGQVLGSVFIDERLIEDFASLLEPRDFHRLAHQEIFRAMLENRQAGKPVDEITVTATLRAKLILDDCGGYTYVSDLPVLTPSTVSADWKARQVKRRSIERQGAFALNMLGGREQTPAIRAIYERATKAVEDLDALERKKTDSGKSVAKLTLKKIEELHESKGQLLGIPTGLSDLDNALSGFQKGDLIILAARPSVGKTALALNILANATIDHKKNALMISLEMSNSQLGQRILSSRARVNLSKFRTSTASAADFGQMMRAAQDLSNSTVTFFDMGRITVDGIRAHAKESARLGILDLIVIDYLQLMDGEYSERREQEIAGISRGLKNMAREFNVPILALAQLNRKVEERGDKRPMLSDLRDSGSLEQDADIVLLLYRDELYNPESKDAGTAELNIAKNRNGPTKVIKLKFSGELTRFDDLADSRTVQRDRPHWQDRS